MTHAWQPIQPPKDAGALERQELRALERLWRSAREDLERRGALAPFWERMARWWSIETGVIERIFDLSLGVTRVLVAQGFAAALIPHGEADRPAEDVVAILADHREALDVVLDVVGGARELTVGWIKELHALLCRHQEFAHAEDPYGNRVRIPLPLGQYKLRPNTVTLADGTKHEYCPSEHVAAEMERLVTLYAELPPELPEVRSAWLHHAFTQIHPFEDANGRVARALASIDFLRARLFPLLIERGDRDTAYVPALVQADRGDLAPLVALFTSRQERIVRKAISEAEAAVEVRALDDELRAAREKLARRKLDAADGPRRMVRRNADLATLAADHMRRAAERVRGTVPAAKAKVHARTASTAHYFRAQILEQARRREYWADLRNPWEWVNLVLRDGGVTNFVVALHLVGNPSPGAAVAIAFMTHRAKDTDVLLESTSLPLEPLMLYPDEEVAAQKRRFEPWLAEAERQAVHAWIRYL